MIKIYVRSVAGPLICCLLGCRWDFVMTVVGEFQSMAQRQFGVCLRVLLSTLTDSKLIDAPPFILRTGFLPRISIGLGGFPGLKTRQQGPRGRVLHRQQPWSA